MANIQDQEVQLSRTMTNVTSQLNRLELTIGQIVGKLSQQSNTMASSLKAGADKAEKSFDAAGLSVSRLGDEVVSVQKSLKDADFTNQLRDQRRQWDQKLYSESQFFNRDKQIKYEHEQVKLEQLRGDKEHLDRSINQQKEQDTISKERLESERAIAKDYRQQRIEAQIALDDFNNANMATQQKVLGEINAIETRIASEKSAFNRLDLQTQLDNLLEQKNLHDQQFKLLDDQVRAMEAAEKAHTSNARNEIKKLKQSRELLKEQEKAAEKFKEAIEHQINEVNTADIGKSFEQMKKDLIAGAKNLFSSIVPAATGLSIQQGISGILEEIRTGLNTGMGQLGMGDAIAMGMSKADLMALTAEHRSAVIASGGLTKSLNILSETATEATHRGLTASREEATKFGAQQMEMYKNIGVVYKSSSKALNQYDKIQKVTGMTLGQFGDSIRDIMEDESTLLQMRLAGSQAEREAIAESIQARYAENRLRGISDAQTRAMMKKQMEMQTQKPLTRLQTAIKHAALASAMGVQGGSDLISMAMKPKLSQSEQDRRQNIYDNMSQQVDRGLGSDNFATQLLTSALTDGLKFDQQEMSVFNTKLTEAVQQGIKEGFADTMGKTEGIYKGINVAIEHISGFFKDSWVMLLGGAIGALATALPFHTTAMLLHSKALTGKGITDMVKGLFGVGKNNPGSATPGTAGLPGTSTPGAAGRITNAVGVGKAIGFSKGVVGLSAVYGAVESYQTYDKDKQNKGEAVGKGIGVAGGGIGGAAVGSTIGTMIFPGVGTVIGGLVGGWLGSEGGAIVGESVGKSIDDMSKKTSAQTSQAKIKEQAFDNKSIKDDQGNKQTEGTSKNKTLEDKHDHETQTTNIQSQLKKMDESNGYLAAVVKNTQQLTDIANKQLLAITLTEDEKKDSRTRLRNDNNMGTHYNYIFG